MTRSRGMPSRPFLACPERNCLLYTEHDSFIADCLGNILKLDGNDTRARDPRPIAAYSVSPLDLTY